jgi:hypothetical protein
MLEKEYEFYKKNKSTLLKKYQGQFIVIKDGKVEGVHPDEKTAYQESIKKWELGTFLIQHCLPKDEEVIQIFHSRMGLGTYLLLKHCLF